MMLSYKHIYDCNGVGNEMLQKALDALIAWAALWKLTVLSIK